MKKITIDFAEDGSIKIDGQGFSGTDCDKAMGEFERELGTATKRVNKPEYRQAHGATAKQVQ